MHQITHVEHPVALDDHVGVLEHQVTVSERPEVRLSPAEDDRPQISSSSAGENLR